MNTVTELLQPVENDLDDLILELKNLIGAGHPILQAAAEHLFSAGGKRLRPGIVLLISKYALSVSRFTETFSMPLVFFNIFSTVLTHPPHFIPVIFI